MLFVGTILGQHVASKSVLFHVGCWGWAGGDALPLSAPVKAEFSLPGPGCAGRLHRCAMHSHSSRDSDQFSNPRAAAEAPLLLWKSSPLSGPHSIGLISSAFGASPPISRVCSMLLCLKIHTVSFKTSLNKPKNIAGDFLKQEGPC